MQWPVSSDVPASLNWVVAKLSPREGLTTASSPFQLKAIKQGGKAGKHQIDNLPSQVTIGVQTRNRKHHGWSPLSPAFSSPGA